MVHLMTAGEAALVAGSIVKDAVTGLDFTPIYSEFVSLIPVLIPVTVTFIAVKKGISFLLSTLQNA